MKPTVFSTGFVSQAVLLFLTFCLFQSCNTTEPPPSPPPKDPRTYTWTVDTLAYPGSFQTTMRDIWASAPNNVYVVGRNDQAGWGTMYHFDGSRWTPVRLLVNQGGTIGRGFDLSAICGFAPNDIYAVGNYIYDNPNPPPNFLDSSLIIHFDGVQWREQTVVPNGRQLLDVWGASRNDVWACGVGGLLLHFDGANWLKDSISMSVPPNGSFQLGHLMGRGSLVWMMGVVFDYNLVTETHYFFARTQQMWNVVNSFRIGGGQSEHKWGAAGMWTGPLGVLYSVGAGVFRLDGDTWTRFFSSAGLTAMNGINEQSLFVVGFLGKVFHYNGSDWYQFTQLENPNVVYTGVCTDGNEVFIVGYTFDAPQKTVVLHGR
jgi:hypothetical protein